MFTGKMRYMGIIISTLLLFCTGIFFSAVPTFAAEGNIGVSGKAYEFSDKSHYEITASENYISTSNNSNTYGDFFLYTDADLIDEINGIPHYAINDQKGVSLFYTYTDKLLNAKETELHLISDNSKKVDDFKLKANIKNGAIFIEASRDGVNWVTEYEKCNLFSETPIKNDSLYTINEAQLTNGCFYKVTVVYQTEVTTGSKKVGPLSLAEKNSVKHAELYEFYLKRRNENKDTSSLQMYKLGSRVRVEKDKGYIGSKTIDTKDPHYGWDLGNFFVSGYTDDEKDEEGNIVFLKNLGDTVTLWFKLDQNINKLNDNDSLSIVEDKEGFDQYFETMPTNFGKGALITRYTDYKNIKHKPTLYTNYLTAYAATGADTQVDLFEEGDYEIAFDYAVQNDKRKLLGQSVLPEVSRYRIYFKFSVRNSNCMVYPFDIKTKAELSDRAITENGFKLDLAKSRYLDINIVKENIQKDSSGTTTDTRFNKSAKDGNEYTDEGIYTITVSNKYTGQTTVKTIYVGNEDVMKAFITGKEKQ